MYVHVKSVNIFPFSSQELEQVFRGMMRSVEFDECEGMNTHLLFAAHKAVSAGSQRGPAVPLVTLHIIFIDAMSQYLWWRW